VRIVPVDGCLGIGIASPKGVDPMSYRGVVLEKLNARPHGQMPDRENEAWIVESSS